ncbi:hypothetical protein PM082_024502 [Marasmius tenuissimus]|nr:hypothetical protein PM082_024502 [Marasmius tenuissimus]
MVHYQQCSATFEYRIITLHEQEAFYPILVADEGHQLTARSKFILPVIFRCFAVKHFKQSLPAQTLHRSVIVEVDGMHMAEFPPGLRHTSSKVKSFGLLMNSPVELFSTTCIHTASNLSPLYSPPSLDIQVLTTALNCVLTTVRKSLKAGTASLFVLSLEVQTTCTSDIPLPGMASDPNSWGTISHASCLQHNHDMVDILRSSGKPCVCFLALFRALSDGCPKRGTCCSTAGEYGFEFLLVITYSFVHR